MKPYGQPRGAGSNRKLRGTPRPCPCCVTTESYTKSRHFKKRARWIAKQAQQIVSDSIV